MIKNNTEVVQLHPFLKESPKLFPPNKAPKTTKMITVKIIGIIAFYLNISMYFMDKEVISIFTPSDNTYPISGVSRVVISEEYIYFVFQKNEILSFTFRIRRIPLGERSYLSRFSNKELVFFSFIVTKIPLLSL